MHVPDLSRRKTIALVAVIVGIVAITLALLGGTHSDGAARPDRTRSIDPIAPLDPNDADDADDADDKSAKRESPLKDLDDPFATGFGGNVKHKVTVRATANGPAGFGVRYRDRPTWSKRSFTGSYSTTRTIKSRFPTVQVAVQIYPPASTGSCTVIIDGEQVSSHTTNKRFGVVLCGG